MKRCHLLTVLLCFGAVVCTVTVADVAEQIKQAEYDQQQAQLVCDARLNFIPPLSRTHAIRCCFVQEITKCNEEVAAVEDDVKKLVASLKSFDAEIDKHSAQLKELMTHLDKANSEQEQVCVF